MAICRVFQNLDGSVSIMRLNPRLGDSISLDGETAKNDSLEGLPFFDMDETSIPKNRESRKTWKIKNNKLIEDKT